MFDTLLEAVLLSDCQESGIRYMPLDIENLMWNYARQGIAHWDKAPDAIKRRAIAVLSNRIADKEWQASNTIKNANENGADCQFIPMPNINHKGILFCFFLPMRSANGQKVLFAFDLFLLVDQENCLGFRFEPADPPDQSHGYGHIQMNRTMLNKTFSPHGIPDWLSDSYPAFPIGTSDPVQMFLLMTMSVHGHGSGYADGMTRVLLEAFQNSAGEAMKYLERLKNFLN